MYSRGSGRFHLFSKPILLFPFDSCMVSYFHWSRRSLLSSSSSWSTFLFGTGSKVSTNDNQPTFLSRSSIDHKMDLKLIKSGREKIQILHHGFRLKRDKGPKGPNKTTYWACVVVGCKGRAATSGELTLDDLSLKYHHLEQHNHHADEAQNLVSEKLYEFREQAKTNPDKTAKSVYEKIVRETMNSVDTPEKANLAAKLPKFYSIKDQHYR